MSWQERASSLLRAHVPSGSRILVAVSGGPDSVALAHFLLSQPYPLVIGHVDHQMRKGSAHDADFVCRMARAWDIPFRVKRGAVPAYARTHHLGLEEAARNVRYAKLSAMARHAGCSVIVTAHTADDQAETVLMNFLRGAGPAGLSGMPVARGLNHGSRLMLVRPFLGLHRKQILVYLKSHSLSSREDPTNDSFRYTRNRIRHATLPYLEKRSPGLRERLTRSADIFRQEEDFWRQQVLQEFHKTVRKNGQKFTVVLPRLLGYHNALSRRILRHVLPGTSFQDIEQVLKLARSSVKAGLFKFPGGWRVRRINQRMVISQKRTG